MADEVKNVETTKTERTTEDIAMEFLQQRKDKILEIYQIGQEIKNAKKKENQLKTERKKQKDELKTLMDNQDMVLRVAKLPTPAEEDNNRVHYPVKTFFDFLKVADDDRDSLSKKVNGLHDIKTVCECFLESAWQYRGKDNTRNLLTVDIDKFKRLLDESYASQRRRKEDAEKLLDEKWAVFAAEEKIREVITQQEKDAERASRFKKGKKNSKAES